jgi:hypothetical protein
MKSFKGKTIPKRKRINFTHCGKLGMMTHRIERAAII